MKVTLVSYEAIPLDQRDNQPNNGFEKEYASYLKVENPGKPAIYFSDAMKPGDTKFYRDLSWVADALEAAYAAGKEAAG